jgi:hypothetical protein
MGSRQWICGIALVCLLPRAAAAQWADPKLIAGQVGFNVAVSFIGKLVLQHEPPGRAFKKALAEGSVSGLIAHTGYTIVGQHPNWALAGKALAQKSSLTTRRSMHGLPVFDETFYQHWELTHSFIHFKFHGTPRFELDVINAAFSSYYMLAGNQYSFDAKRTLLAGSLVFLNHDPPPGLRGYYVPGALWIDATKDEADMRDVLAHELIHSLQAERGTSIHEWHHERLRFNWLVFASGVPAFFAGWPEHDKRWHEREADAYPRLP